MAVVKKPRRFYVSSVRGLGGPTFAVDGKLLGIGVRRIYKNAPTVPVVLPAEDVKEIVVQALAKAAADKKAAAEHRDKPAETKAADTGDEAGPATKPATQSANDE